MSSPKKRKRKLLRCLPTGWCSSVAMSTGLGGTPVLDAALVRPCGGSFGGAWDEATAAAFAAAIAAQCSTHGYCIVHNMLSREVLDQKASDLRRVLEDVPLGRNDFEGHSTKRIYAIFNKTRVMDDLATHPVVLGVVENLLRTPWFQFSSPTGIRIGPGEKEQPLHRDDNKYPIPKPHPEVVVNSMWTFDDFTEENGCVRWLPTCTTWEGGRKSAIDGWIWMNGCIDRWTGR